MYIPQEVVYPTGLPQPKIDTDARSGDVSVSFIKSCVHSSTPNKKCMSPDIPKGVCASFVYCSRNLLPEYNTFSMFIVHRNLKVCFGFDGLHSERSFCVQLSRDFVRTAGQRWCQEHAPESHGNVCEPGVPLRGGGRLHGVGRASQVLRAFVFAVMPEREPQKKSHQILWAVSPFGSTVFGTISNQILPVLTRSLSPSSAASSLLHHCPQREFEAVLAAFHGNS